MFKKNNKSTIIMMLVIMVFHLMLFPVFADDAGQFSYDTDIKDDTYGTKESPDGLNGSKNQALDEDNAKGTLITMFGTDVWKGTNITAGVNMAKPAVKVIMTFAIAVVVIICFLFFFVTALDLAYITVPIVRPLLSKGKESMDTKSGGKFVCISDSAVAAVEGKGSGGMEGDRGVGSALLKYISSRTVEFVAFVLFVIFFFTGILGDIVVMLFNLLYSIIDAVLNIA